MVVARLFRSSEVSHFFRKVFIVLRAGSLKATLSADIINMLISLGTQACLICKASLAIADSGFSLMKFQISFSASLNLRMAYRVTFFQLVAFQG